MTMPIAILINALTIRDKDVDIIHIIVVVDIIVTSTDCRREMGETDSIIMTMVINTETMEDVEMNSNIEEIDIPIKEINTDYVLIKDVETVQTISVIDIIQYIIQNMRHVVANTGDSFIIIN